MKTSPGENRNSIAIYLVLTLLISSIFYFLVIKSGLLGGGSGSYVVAMMWSPALAAILTLRIQNRSTDELGWKRGKSRYLVGSYLIPLLYATIAYVIVWSSGLGGFYNAETVNNWTAAFGLGVLPPSLTIVMVFIFRATTGMIRSMSTALGEEIGWRGFLVPELYKRYSFTTTSLISGIIWSVWHYPILLFADYNSGTPAWYGLSCFTVMVVSSSFIYTWMRLKSGSVWTGVLLHASHNLFIQAFFTPLTADTGNTAYVIDEFGFMVPLLSVLFAIYFWTRRGELPKPNVPITARVQETVAGGSHF
jgi:membrane protease YdiL (CAAX protease family)